MESGSLARYVPRGVPPGAPALGVYWASFAAWWLGRLKRRWSRSVLLDRLGHAVLDVGEALVGEPGQALGRLDRFAWLVDVGGQARMLDAEELSRARQAIDTTRALLARAPAA